MELHAIGEEDGVGVEGHRRDGDGTTGFVLGDRLHRHRVAYLTPETFFGDTVLFEDGPLALGGPPAVAPHRR